MCTLQENILFGLPYDSARYEAVLEVREECKTPIYIP